MAKNTYVGTHYVDKNGKWIPSKDKENHRNNDPGRKQPGSLFFKSETGITSEQCSDRTVDTLCTQKAT